MTVCSGIVHLMHPMLNIAVRAARSAGRILLRYFERTDQIAVSSKRRNDFVSEVDQAAEEAIIQELRSKYPDHSILAEESGEQRRGDFQWVIDPLDGTTNYLHGFPQFSVSIALKYRDRLEQAVVYDPLREEMFTASRGQGAQLNDRRLRVAERASLEGALLGTGFPYRDHRHLDAYLGMLKAMIQDTAGIRRPGSAALDFAYVAAGRSDGFWELGLAQWDFAAGALLVTEAGGTVSDLAGGDRHLETGNVVAGNLKIHQAMIARLRPFLSASLRA
jgi:myo-inositol-1(or 4)-monophosphatase